MKICVAGWYFRAQWLRDLSLSGHEVFVVKHREGETQGLPSKLYPNLGLEFGAYRMYVENHWDGDSSVFFCHDDVEISDMIGFRDLEALEGSGVDHCYVFHDEYDEFINGGAHGRGMWIRGPILRKLREDFPADMENQGENIGKVAQNGIFAFHKRIIECGANTGVIAIVPQFRFAHRGRLHDRMFLYRKTHSAVPGGLVNVSE